VKLVYGIVTRFVGHDGPNHLCFCKIQSDLLKAIAHLDQFLLDPLVTLQFLTRTESPRCNQELNVIYSSTFGDSKSFFLSPTDFVVLPKDGLIPGIFHAASPKQAEYEFETGCGFPDRKLVMQSDRGEMIPQYPRSALSITQVTVIPVRFPCLPPRPLLGEGDIQHRRSVNYA